MKPRRHEKKTSLLDFLIPLVFLCAIVGSVVYMRSGSLALEDQSSDLVLMKSKSDELASMPKLEYELVKSEGPADKPDVLRYRAIERLKDGTFIPVSVHRWASLMTHKSMQYAGDVAYFFNDILKTVEMDAYFFETKGVTYKSSQEKVFEFVLVRSDYLHKFADSQQDISAFKEHLNCDPSFATACVFNNLGGDSILIAPKKSAKGENVYGHLGSFSRRAPITQIMQVWRLVAETFLSALESNPEKPVWLNTDGTGVAWLHIRIDPKPKYYDYKPFANES